MPACMDGSYPEPHVWKLAERVYQALGEEGAGAQSVVVSGESGAGIYRPERPHHAAFTCWVYVYLAPSPHV